MRCPVSRASASLMVTDPQRQARLGPFHDLALRISHRSMLAAHVPVLRRALLPIGLFDERELNFLPEAAAGETSTAMALDRWRSGRALSASRLHADSRDGGFRSDRTGPPRQKDRLSGSHGTSDIRISAPSKSMKERHLLMRHEIGGAQHDGISAKSWRAMFSATWSRQGLLKGVQFLVISSTKSVLPRPAGKAFYAISRPNVRGKMKRFANPTSL